MKFIKSVCLSSAILIGSHSAWVFAVSEDPLQQFKLASLAYQNGRLDTAEQEFQGFMKAFPGHRLAAQAQFALGEIKFSLKQYPEAASEYTVVVKKFGGSYEALNAELRLGHCEFNMKKYLNSVDHFTIVKNKAPKALRSEALLGCALAYLALNDHDKSAALLTDLLQSYPKYKNNPSAVVPLGLIYMERNRLQEAL